MKCDKSFLTLIPLHNFVLVTCETIGGPGVMNRTICCVFQGYKLIGVKRLSQLNRHTRIQTECVELCGHQLHNLVKYNRGAAILSNPKELQQLQVAKYNRTVARLCNILSNTKDWVLNLHSMLQIEFKGHCENISRNLGHKQSGTRKTRLTSTVNVNVVCNTITSYRLCRVKLTYTLTC